MWRSLFRQYTAAVTACLSVLTAGSCVGWITPLMNHLLGPDSEIPMTAGDMTWVVSSMELGTLMSSFVGGYLVTHMGRKPLLLVTGPLFIISWLVVLFWPTVLVLVLVRMVHGFLIGFTFIAGPVYLGEIASDSNRGAITSLFYMSWWLGYIISLLVGANLSYYPFTFFTLALNIPFVLMFYWQPESPYYLVMVGDMDKAVESLKWLRDPFDRKLKEEVEMIKKSVQDEVNSLSAIRDLVATPRDRKALTLLFVISAVRITCAGGCLMAYIPQVFDLTPNLSVSPDTFAMSYGVVMLFGGLVSIFTTDKVGRRPLLFVSSLGCLCCTFLLGSYYFLLTNTSMDVYQVSWISPMLVLLNAILFTIGISPICIAYTSELFASNTRGLAASVSSITSGVFAFFWLMIFHPISDWLGLYANFFFYTIITLLGFVFFCFTAPETKGKSFLEIRNELHEIYGM